MSVTACPDPRTDPVACVKWAIARQAESSQDHWRYSFRVLCSYIPGGIPRFAFSSSSEAGLTTNTDTFVILDSDLDENNRRIQASEVFTKVPASLANDVSYPSMRFPQDCGARPPGSYVLGVFSSPASAILFPPTDAGPLGYLYFVARRAAETQSSLDLPIEAQSEHCLLVTDLIASPDTVVLIAKASGLTDCLYTLGVAGEAQKMELVSDPALYCAFMAFIEVAIRVQPRATYNWIIKTLAPVANAGIWACEKIHSLPRLDKLKCKRSNYEIPAQVFPCKYMRGTESSPDPDETAWQPQVVRPVYRNNTTRQPPIRIIYSNTHTQEAVSVVVTPAFGAPPSLEDVGPVLPTPDVGAPALTNSNVNIPLAVNTTTITPNSIPMDSSIFMHSTPFNAVAFTNITHTNPFAATNIANAQNVLGNITLTSIANAFTPVNSTSSNNTNTSQRRKRYRRHR